MAKAASSVVKSRKKLKKAKAPRIPYSRHPEGMELDLWQLGLRKQFGEENEFHITNTGAGPIFSEYIVWNPASNNSYSVTIRIAIPKKGMPLENSLNWIGNTCNCPDFKTNRLGLCKHISAVLHKVHKKRGVKKLLAVGSRPAHSMIYVDYRRGPRVRLYIGANPEKPLLEWAARFFDADGLLLEEAVGQFEPLIKEVRNIQPEFKCSDEVYDLIAEKREYLRRSDILQRMLPLGPNSSDFDQLLKAPLFPYQKQGIWFAINAGRCLLADEMGLGKTIQAIGAAELLQKTMNIQRVLIVCPTSLKYQWKSEIEKFTNSTVHVVEGIQTRRMEQYGKTEAFYYILSYNTITADAEYMQILGADLLIVDEAQRLKNFRTKVSIQLKKVRTPYCIVLTGTPLENKLEDLYSVMQLIDQNKLPPLYRFLDRYQISGENGQVVGYKNLKEIGGILSDCLIRRVKKAVLKELPKRMDKVLVVQMTEEQKAIHRELGDAVARLVAKWKRFHFLNETDRRILLLCLSQMRMVADSTYILDQQTRFDTKITELMYILEEALADPKQKVVVFSQWERMTRLVAQELDACDIQYAYLHGGISSYDRAELLTRFKEEPQCQVFLSTDAGSVGLNLQSASLLINLDIPWNPAVLEQRVGRIHRMGQAENVTIINMVSAESIEQRILGLLEFKTSMAQGVLDPDGDDTIFMSESRFKKFMENVETMAGDDWPKPSTAMTPKEQIDGESEDFEAPPTPSAPHSGQPLLKQGGFPDDESSSPQLPKVSSEKKPELPTAPKQGLRQEAEDFTSAPSNKPSEKAYAADSPQELIQNGISFFSGLAQTLSNSEKTQELVQSIVATDEKTGQTYLKIPVENAEVVENAVRLLGGLLAGLGRK